MTAGDLLIRGAVVAGRQSDLRITGGRIAAVGNGLPPIPGEAVVEAGGAFALPGLIDAHTHLDKSLMGMGWRPNRLGASIAEKVAAERVLRRSFGLDPHRQALRQIRASLAAGTTRIRTHVDIDTDQGLEALEGVAAACAAAADCVDVEIVAFPQSGLLARPGTADLLDAALRGPATIVGGIDPCLVDRDPRASLDVTFGLAERHDAGVDIHLHEPAEMGLFTLGLFLDRVEAHGLIGRAMLSHGFCLAGPTGPGLDHAIDRLARLGVAVMTIGSPRLPLPPIERLRDTGVEVVTGSDGVRDIWKPFGTVDMLKRVSAVCERANFCRDDEIEAALALGGSDAAGALGLADHGLHVGADGDVVLFDGEALAQVVVDHPPRRLVVKRGRIVVCDGVLLDIGIGDALTE